MESITNYWDIEKCETLKGLQLELSTIRAGISYLGGRLDQGPGSRLEAVRAVVALGLDGTGQAVAGQPARSRVRVGKTAPGRSRHRPGEDRWNSRARPKSVTHTLPPESGY